MDRRGLLKNACCAGLCSCTAAIVLAQDTSAAEKPEDIKEIKDKLNKLQWWSDHCKKLHATVWKKLQTTLDKKTLQGLLETQGRQCAKEIDWAKQYKDNPDGFFKHMNDQFGEQYHYDKDAGVITIHGPEKDCACGMVNSKLMPSCFCHCSVGWQKQTYETILGKAVDVEILESILKGNKRCAFKITIKNSTSL